MLITPISQTNYSFKNEDSRSVQTKQNKNKTDRVLLYSLMGFSALIAISMLDRTSKTRLQKFFAEEVEGKNKTKEMNLHKTIEIEKVADYVGRDVVLAQKGNLLLANSGAKTSVIDMSKMKNGQELINGITNNLKINA